MGSAKEGGGKERTKGRVDLEPSQEEAVRGLWETQARRSRSGEARSWRLWRGLAVSLWEEREDTLKEDLERGVDVVRGV